MAYGDPTTKIVSKKLPTLTPEQLNDFSNFSGSTDVSVINKTLSKYGLKGSDYLNQPYTGTPDASNPNSITGAQQDWIGSTTSRAIANARKLGIPPEAFEANKEVIFGKDRYSDTIFNNKDFARMYPNYMQTVGSIYKDRLSKYVPKDNSDIASNRPMAMGGETIAGIGSSILPLLTQLLEGGQSFSKQPIVNASAVRNMASPYANMAYGGSIEDLDESELQDLQDVADAQGISIEEAFAMKSQQDDTSGGEEDTEQYDNPQEDNSEGDTTDEENQNTFAFGGMKIKRRSMYSMGGKTAEVEGGEVIETPNGQVNEVKGPKHERGGVDLNLPEGTEVFSNRLKIEGKSMKTRKLDREKRTQKIKDLISKNPNSQLAKNTASRTMENINNENEQDMMLQKVASHIYAPPKDNSERESKKYPHGGTIGEDRNPLEEYLNSINNTTLPPYSSDIPLRGTDYVGGIPSTMGNPSMVSSTDKINGIPKLGYNAPEVKSNTPLLRDNLTTGDYIGMSGTLLGSILPIINTKNNRAATPPNVNRFKGFGHDALADNSTAQNYLDVSRGNELKDIDTEVNSSYERNNNSASSINTARALNAVTNVNADKARSNTRANFAKQMIGVLGQRSQLHNIKDFREMAGQTQTDTENKADTDNYYTNLGANLSNFATGVENVGRNLNIGHSNKVDANLISQLSKYGLEFDKDGNLITKK